MSIELVLIALALVVALVANGSPKSIIKTHLNFKWTLLVALAGHLFIELAPIDESAYDTVGFGVLMFTYLALLSFCIANINVRGMWIAFVGIACNAVVTGLNGHMPVTDSGDFVARESIRYSASTSSDLLPQLGSIIPINQINVALSIGDIIFVLGMVVFFFSISRKPSTQEDLSEEITVVDVADADDELTMDVVMTEAALSKNAVAISSLRDNNEYIDIRIDEGLVEPASLEDSVDSPGGSGNVAVLEREDKELVDSSGDVVEGKDSKAVLRSSQKPQRSKNKIEGQAKLEKRRISRSQRRWQQSHGLNALPKPEDLGYDENSMTVVDAAD